MPVTRRRFTQMDSPEERATVQADLDAWGYERALVKDELANSVWIRYGKDLIFWISRTDQDNDGLFHICIRPGARGALNSRRVFTCVDIVGELLGFDGLMALTKERVKSDYLNRLGWTECEDGYYRDLGDD